MTRQGTHIHDGPPQLVMPPEEAGWLRETYSRARVILEYGAGGSTALAAEMPGKTIFSVEGDPQWSARMEAWFAANPPLSQVVLHEVPIGPTGAWGMPSGEEGWRKYHRYPLSVWDRLDFVQPDVVLIDGRFRPACLLAVMYRSNGPVTVLFDDYTSRPAYREVEAFLRPAEIRGRMARFEILPQPFPAERMMDVMDFFTRPL